MPISVAQLREIRTVTLSDGERYRFFWLEHEAAFHLASEKITSLDDRHYLAEALSRLLEEPALSPEELLDWSDAKLLELTNAYLAKGTGVAIDERQKFPPASDIAGSRHSLEGLIKASRDRMIESSKRIMEAFSSSITRLVLPDSSLWLPGMNGIMAQAAGIQKQVTESALNLSNNFTGVSESARTAIENMTRTQSFFTNSLQEALESRRRMESVVAGLASGFGQIDFSSTISAFTNFTRLLLAEQLEQFREDRRAEVIIDANLEFLFDYADQSIQPVVDRAAFVPAERRQAHITRKLYKITSSDEFWTRLEEELTSTSVTSRRLAIFSAIRGSHGDRNHLLTIPALLAQVEGLLASLLGEMGIIKWNRLAQKWYEVDPKTGTYRKKPDGKRAEIYGLTRLTQRGRSKTSDTLEHTLPHLENKVARYRNLVLHGSKTDYGRSRDSSTLLIQAFILAREIRNFEEGSNGFR